MTVEGMIRGLEAFCRPTVGQWWQSKRGALARIVTAHSGIVWFVTYSAKGKRSGRGNLGTEEFTDRYVPADPDHVRAIEEAKE